jgi:hypothetical protein
MYAHGINIFNKANRDHLIFRVTNYFQLKLFPAYYRLLNQHLPDQAGSNSAAGDCT